jgi:hypothetical protein
MAEEAHPSAGENGSARIDPKLNMFALANGLDLIKSDRAKRLTWFTGSAWPTESPAEATTTFVSDAVPATELSATLEQGITVTNVL